MSTKFHQEGISTPEESRTLNLYFKPRLLRSVCIPIPPQEYKWVLKESNFVLRIFSPPQCRQTCQIPICREAHNSTALKVFLPLLESVGGGLNSLIKPLRAFAGHRETQTPLLQSPIQQFEKGGRFYRPLLLCTHYILSSPIRNRTLLSGLKVLSIHHQCFGGICVSTRT